MIATALVNSWLSKIDDMPRRSYGNPIAHCTDYRRISLDRKHDIYGGFDLQSSKAELSSHKSCDHMSSLGCHGNNRRGSDYASDLNWGEGGVKENVQKVIDGLLDTEIQLSRGGVEKKWDDPLLSMEMRHQGVKERRKLRDHAQKMALREKQQEESVRRRAKLLIERERREERLREQREEASIRAHMVAIKRQMKQQKERERSDITLELHIHVMIQHWGICRCT